MSAHRNESLPHLSNHVLRIVRFLPIQDKECEIDVQVGILSVAPWYSIALIISRNGFLIKIDGRAGNTMSKLRKSHPY